MSTDPFDAYVELLSVHQHDFDADERQDAVVEIGCAAGANLTVTSLFAFTDLDGQVTQVGQPLIIERGLVFRTGDTTFETYVPAYGPNEATCCPSTYQRTYWTVDFSSPDVFVSPQPPDTIPTDQVPNAEPRF